MLPQLKYNKAGGQGMIQHIGMDELFDEKLAAKPQDRASDLQGLLKSKSGLFNHGQNILSWTKHFCLGQFRFCPGQKIPYPRK